MFDAARIVACHNAHRMVCRDDSAWLCHIEHVRVALRNARETGLEHAGNLSEGLLLRRGVKDSRPENSLSDVGWRAKH